MENDLGRIGAIAHLAVYLPQADRMVQPRWFAKDLGRRSRERAGDNSKAIIALIRLHRFSGGPGKLSNAPLTLLLVSHG